MVAPNAIQAAFVGAYSGIPRAWAALVAAPSVIGMAFVEALLHANRRAFVEAPVQHV